LEATLGLARVYGVMDCCKSSDGLCRCLATSGCSDRGFGGQRGGRRLSALSVHSNLEETTTVDHHARGFQQVKPLWTNRFIEEEGSKQVQNTVSSETGQTMRSNTMDQTITRATPVDTKVYVQRLLRAASEVMTI